MQLVNSCHYLRVKLYTIIFWERERERERERVSNIVDLAEGATEFVIMMSESILLCEFESRC